MKKSIIIVASIFLLLLSNPILAQTDPGADPDAPVAAPIDGYIWVLALLGLTFVFLKLRVYTKQSNRQSK